MLLVQWNSEKESTVDLWFSQYVYMHGSVQFKDFDQDYYLGAWCASFQTDTADNLMKTKGRQQRDFWFAWHLLKVKAILWMIEYSVCPGLILSYPRPCSAILQPREEQKSSL